MADIQKLEKILRNSNLPFSVRFRQLLESHGFTFTSKAWLGEVLLETLTEEDRVLLKEEVGQLERLIRSWRARAEQDILPKTG